jgi:uncharacterized damage-inducible protein DinB
VIIYTGKDLARSFRAVRGNTITIAEDIPEEKYTFQATPEVRSIGRLLVHIALTPRFQLAAHTNRVVDLSTINFGDVMARAAADEAQPRSKAEIVELLRSEGEAYASFLEGVSNDLLAERVAMPPGAHPASKSRFEMVMSPKEHEMHHRGQLMTMQRLIGQVPHLTRQMQERMAQMQAAAAQPAR